MDLQRRINNGIEESIKLKQDVLADANLLGAVEQITHACIKAFETDGKVLFCGNGGSAADAQHLAGEFSGRFYYDRPPLFSEALHVNGSYLTAVSNDYSYQESYARILKAMGRKGDILFTLSTSGNSANVVRAAEVAREQEMIVVGFTGRSGGLLAPLCDFIIRIPSKDTPRIQECHMLLGHLICELVEATLFPNP
ncbi:MAG: SIS domain-containing protein [Bacteroidota bacterium]